MEFNSTFVTRRGREWPFILADGKKTCAYIFWQGVAHPHSPAVGIFPQLPHHSLLLGFVQLIVSTSRQRKLISERDCVKVQSHELNDKRMGYAAIHELILCGEPTCRRLVRSAAFREPCDKGISGRPVIPVLAGTLLPFTHPLWLNLSKKRCDLFYTRISKN